MATAAPALGFDAERFKQNVVTSVDTALDDAMAEFKDKVARSLADPSNDPAKFERACHGLMKSLRTRAAERAAKFNGCVDTVWTLSDGTLGRGLDIHPGELIAPLRTLQEAAAGRQEAVPAAGDTAMEVDAELSSRVAAKADEVEAAFRRGLQLKRQHDELKQLKEMLQAGEPIMLEQHVQTIVDLKARQQERLASDQLAGARHGA